MEISKDYNPQAHSAKIKDLIENSLGNPFFPTWEEALKKWKGMCEYRSPRTFMFIVDIKQNRSILSNGMKLLGFPDNWEFSGEDFLNLIHENQKQLLVYQTFGLYEIFFSNPKIFRAGGAAYCNSRAIKDRTGKYWLAYQVASPFQFDENGLMVRYLSSYCILGEYRGEALETEIYADPEFSEEQKELRKLIRNIKMNMLEGLGFTKTQKRVIELMSVARSSSKGIAETMEISTKTLAHHRRAILEQAKKVFPLNNFREAKDVVDYLIKQNIS